VDGITAEGLPMDKAARKGLVSRIVLNDLALQNAEEDLVIGEAVGQGFLIRMVCDPYPVGADSSDDPLELHATSPSSKASE
jgi:hypothetical protein